MFWVLLAVLVIVGSIWVKKQEEKEQNQEATRTREREDKYKASLKNIQSKISVERQIEYQPVVTVIEVSSIDSSLTYYTPHYIWKHNNILYLYPTGKNRTWNTDFGGTRLPWDNDIWELISIPIHQIMGYKQTGSVYTTVSGSGGGSSFSPITGFHGKINPVEITSKVHDIRMTQIYYENRNKYESGDSIKTVNLEEKDYFVVQRLIPEKEHKA